MEPTVHQRPDPPSTLQVYIIIIIISIIQFISCIQNCFYLIYLFVLLDSSGDEFRRSTQVISRDEHDQW